MPRKAAPKAPAAPRKVAPRAKPKAKASLETRGRSRTPLPEVAPKAASPSGSPRSDRDTPKIRDRDQTNRRDIQERVERTLSECGRMDHIPKAIWGTKMNKNGQTIADLLYIEVEKKMSSNGKVGARWWSGVFEEFNLQQCLTLDDPSDDSAPPGDLLDAIQTAHNQNPVQAKTKPLEQFLSHCGSMLEGCTYGLLNAVMPCPTLTTNMAYTLQVAIGKSWARMLLYNWTDQT